MQGTDAGVDTYFGLCTYPGRELRHRIDLKVIDEPDTIVEYARDCTEFQILDGELLG